MSDTDKLKLIEYITLDALYCEGESSEFYQGIMTAIGSICDYKEKDNE